MPSLHPPMGSMNNCSTWFQMCIMNIANELGTKAYNTLLSYIIEFAHTIDFHNVCKQLEICTVILYMIILRTNKMLLKVLIETKCAAQHKMS